MKDGAVDRIFGNENNDLVVPTRGVSSFGGVTFAETSVQTYAGGDVHHTNFFSNRNTAESILRFLQIP
jgi:hypothetical protein